MAFNFLYYLEHEENCIRIQIPVQLLLILAKNKTKQNLKECKSIL